MTKKSRFTSGPIGIARLASLFRIFGYMRQSLRTTWCLREKVCLSVCPETFIVLEPMRQVNATSIARSLHCAKPQLDQIRRGKGDVTIHTLKGKLVHSLFDRMLEGG